MTEQKDLPCYEDYYPDWIKYPQKERGFKYVDVEKIIGSSNLLKEFYYFDFSPKPNEKNDRYNSITDYVKSELSKDKTQLKLGLIHLFKFKNQYFVGNDGNRRISNCKMLKVQKIRAEITEVLIP